MARVRADEHRGPQRLRAGTAAALRWAAAAGLAESGIRDRLFIMQSNGGTMSFARRRPNADHDDRIGSGSRSHRRSRHRRADRAARTSSPSTSAARPRKRRSIENGELQLTTEYRIERRPDYPGYPIKAPVVDIVEIGAGRWLDRLVRRRGRPERRPAERRRRPGTGLLPGRRQLSRPSPTPISSPAGSIRTTSWGARSRCRSIGPRTALRTDRRPARRGGRRGGARRDPDRQRQHGQRAEARLGPPRSRPA